MSINGCKETQSVKFLLRSLTMKKLFIFLILLVMTAIPLQAALTNGVGDIVFPTAYWWTGQRPFSSPTGDQGLGWMQEVETIIEAWTLDGSNDTMTFANGLTIDNAADNVMEWNENSDELKWTFGSNKIALSSTDVLEISLGDIYLGFTEISAPAGHPSADNGWLYVKDDATTTKLYFEDSTGTVTDILASASGNTLNAAYDQGGNGAGRTITADTGAVALTNTDADTAFLMTINAVPGSSAALGGIEITVGSNSTEAAIEFENTGSGPDLLGTAGWNVTKAGVGTFANVVTALITSTGTTSLGDGTGTVAIDSSSWDITTAGAVSGITTLGMSGDLTNSAGDIILATGKGVKSSTTTAHTVGLYGYDVDGAGYVGSILLTNANTIAVTIGTNVETLAIDTTTWDVTTAGVFSGITGLTVDGDSTFNDQIAVNLNANDEEILVTGTATNVTADNLVEIVMAAQDTDTYIMALTQTPNADGNNDYIICADTTGSGVMFTLKDGGETAWTLDPGVDVTITAAAHTSVTGALDIDFDGNADGSEAVNIKATVNTGGGGAETMSALHIDLDDDADAASLLYGIRIIPTDVDGSATVIGIDLGATLDVGMNIEVGAALKGMTIDAATIDSTQTAGVIDIEFDSKTTNSEAINIKATMLTASGGVNVAGMEIELDNDGNSGSDILYGVIINVTDSGGTGAEKGIYVKGAGIDAALQADTGYIRVGTGSSPTITPGDDDIYAEGTIEADGGLSLGTTLLQSATIELSNSDIDDLKGAPKELVAAPSAGELIEFVSAILIHDYAGTNVWTEADDNLVIEYDDGSGAAVSETIEMTGFIDAAVDQLTRAIPVKDPIGTAASQVAKNIVLINNDDNFAGNGGDDNTMTVIITYRVISALGL
jgi:hypothetical protein